MGGWNRLDIMNGTTRLFGGLFWWEEVKFDAKSTEIRGGLGPRDENRPENAQTGGAPRHGQHKK
jgi:hypothetical protein